MPVQPLVARRTMYPTGTSFQKCSDSIELWKQFENRTDEYRMAKYIATAAKEQIASIVYTMTETLVRGDYQLQGSCTITLAGTKGSGKTDALKRSCIHAACRHPSNLVVVYHQYSRHTDSYVRPVNLIISRMVEVDHVTDVDLHNYREVLVQRNWYALLVLDEIEHMYAALPEHHDRVRPILDDLSDLGCNSEGLICTVLCSSSPFMHSLIQGKVVDGFPVSKSDITMDLNSSKFRPRYVIQPPFCDVELHSLFDSLGSFHALNGTDDSDKRGRRNVASFFSCSNVRHFFTKECDIDGFITDMTMTTTLDDDASATTKQFGHTIMEVNSRLWDLNKHLFKDVLDKESQFRRHILKETCWSELMLPMNFKANDSLAFRSEVKQLVFKGWFAANIELSKIYPLSPYALLAAPDNHKGSSPTLRSIMQLYTYFNARHTEFDIATAALSVLREALVG